jgi:hypothetical protein
MKRMAPRALHRMQAPRTAAARITSQARPAREARPEAVGLALALAVAAVLPPLPMPGVRAAWVLKHRQVERVAASVGRGPVAAAPAAEVAAPVASVGRALVAEARAEEERVERLPSRA